LSELLVTPVIFRENLPLLADLPFVSAAGMRDMAEFGGYSAGAIRTAMSRLRASGAVETFTDRDGVTRYRMTPIQRSVSHAVQGRHTRPHGFLLAIFSFASDDVRERQVVRDALKLHGFQKLAQNVYINGQINTDELEDMLRENGLSENVYLFRCPDVDDPVLRRKLTELFDVAGRKKVLLQLQRDLSAFLEERGISDDEFARRYFYAGPIHYRITFAEEPPLPARYLPADYPLEKLSSVMPALAEQRSRALVQYYRKTNQ
jgi:DNA-binding transcriptional regulator PaaX